MNLQKKNWIEGIMEKGSEKNHLPLLKKCAKGLLKNLNQVFFLCVKNIQFHLNINNG